MLDSPGRSLTDASSSRKPRIALVSPFLDRKHGTESRVVECLERLAADYEFHVYSCRVEDSDFSRFHWHRVPSIPGPYLLKFLWWLVANHAWRWWQQKRHGFRYDLVYTPGTNCFDADAISVHIVFAEFLRQVRPGLRFSRYPLWFWPRLAHRHLYYRLIIALEKRIYPRKDVRIAVISRKTAVDLHFFYGRKNGLRIVYHGLEIDRFSPERRLRLRGPARQELGYADGQFVVLLIGNDFAKKGVRTLLEAAGRVAGPGWQLLIVGDDHTAPYRKLISQAGLADRVRFVPTRREVESFYAAADAYAGPSLEDAFALPPAEAMACGLPAIVSRQAGVSELITHGENGFVLEDPQDAATLAHLLRKLALEPDLRLRIGESAARTARLYTWERNAEQMKQFFEDVLRINREKRSRL